MICPVGHSFSDGLIPSPHRTYLLPDAAIEGLVGRVMEAAKGDDPEPRIGVIIMDAGHHSYICPTCNRFFVIDPDLNKFIASYVKE